MRRWLRVSGDVMVPEDKVDDIYEDAGGLHVVRRIDTWHVNPMQDPRWTWTIPGVSLDEAVRRFQMGGPVVDLRPEAGQ